MAKYMQILMLSCAAIALASAPCSAGQLRVKDVAAMRDAARGGAFAARADWNALSYYLQGAMEAISLAQRELEAADRTALFCPPKGQSMDISDVYAMLDNARKADADAPVTDAILAALRQRFPCR